jgi:hypothetical protein
MGSYSEFSVLLRDEDDYVNAPKLVKEAYGKESKA